MRRLFKDGAHQSKTEFMLGLGSADFPSDTDIPLQHLSSLLLQYMIYFRLPSRRPSEALGFRT